MRYEKGRATELGVVGLTGRGWRLSRILELCNYALFPCANRCSKTSRSLAPENSRNQETSWCKFPFASSSLGSFQSRNWAVRCQHKIAHMVTVMKVLKSWRAGTQELDEGSDLLNLKVTLKDWKEDLNLRPEVLRMRLGLGTFTTSRNSPVFPRRSFGI